MTKLSKEHFQAFAEKYPERYVELKKQAAYEQAYRQTLKRRELECAASVEIQLRTCMERLQKALIVHDVPSPDLSSVEGLVAFRQWRVVNGELCSSGTWQCVWKSVMVADSVPTPDNTHGLYCIKLDPVGLVTQVIGHIGLDVCGLVELRGRIVEHYDRVMRAEWARILCVFWRSCYADVYSGVPALIQNYPGVPIYVTTLEKIARLLFRVAVWQERNV